jgi:hypothetical protein
MQENPRINRDIARGDTVTRVTKTGETLTGKVTAVTVRGADNLLAVKWIGGRISTGIPSREVTKA